jgi:hypothetical protein
LDDFVTIPISPSEKKTKLDVSIQDTQQAGTKWENNLSFTNIKEMESSTDNVEENIDGDDESLCERVRDEEQQAEDEEVKVIGATEVEEVQVIELSEEPKVIETLEELEIVLEDVLAPPTNSPVVSKVKTTVSFGLDLLMERNRAQRDSPKLVTEKRFLARINPGDAAAAEAELSRQISQSDFEKVYIFVFFKLCKQYFVIAALLFLDGSSWPV